MRIFNIFKNISTNIKSISSIADRTNEQCFTNYGNIGGGASKNYSIGNGWRGLLIVQSSSAEAGLYSLISTSSGGIALVTISAMTNVTVSGSAGTITISNSRSGNIYISSIGTKKMT